MSVDSQDPNEIAERIERYLDEHPHAADSVEGIAHWWLTRQRYEGVVRVVEQALEILVRRGSITPRLLRDGQTLYERTKGPAT
jgi:hypothetical protein